MRVGNDPCRFRRGSQIQVERCPVTGERVDPGLDSNECGVVRAGDRRLQSIATGGDHAEDPRFFGVADAKAFLTRQIPDRHDLLLMVIDPRLCLVQSCVAVNGVVKLFEDPFALAATP